MTDVVHDLRIGLKELAAEDRAGWAPLALSDRVREVTEVKERSELELIRVLADWDRVGAWGEDGAVTAVAWMKANLDMAPGEATGLFHLARFYNEHRVVADALDGHRLSVAAARVLLRASRRREEIFAACVDGLVQLGCELSLGEFSTVMAQWADLVDEQAPADDSKRRVRSVDVGEQGITEIVGSPEDAAVIRAWLEAEDRPDPADAPDGPRTREQRHYDLVIDLFRRALADKLDATDPMTLGGVDIIADPYTVAEAIAEHDPTLADLLIPYREGDLQAILARRLEHPDGRPATRAFLKELLCSGFVRRVIVDPFTGAILDLGRSHRLFTKRQIRALAVRDGGCVFPGCDRKPMWCDAHHLLPYDDGGRTDLANGALLCRRHHTLIHKRGWKLRRDRNTGIFTATAPDGREFTRGPRERC